MLTQQKEYKTTIHNNIIEYYTTRTLYNNQAIKCTDLRGQPEEVPSPQGEPQGTAVP